MWANSNETGTESVILDSISDTTEDSSYTSKDVDGRRIELPEDCPVNRCERRHGKLYKEKGFKHGHKNARRGGNSKYIY